MSLRTPSGALDETVDAVLMAHSKDEAQVELRFHTALVEPAERPPALEDDPADVSVHPLEGTLRVTGTDDPEGDDLAFLELWLAFTDLGINGHADGWMYGLSDGRLRLASQLATVGDVCESGWGFPIGPDIAPLDDDTTPSTNDVLALLNSLELNAVRDDGSRERVDVDFEYLPESACGYPGDDTSLTFAATLSFTAALSGDAALEAHWPVALRVQTDGSGVLERVSMNMSEDAGPSAESLQREWGVMGLALDGYDTVGIDLEMTVEPTMTEPTVTGELRIRGYVTAPGVPVSSASGDLLGHLLFENASTP